MTGNFLEFVIDAVLVLWRPALEITVLTGFFYSIFALIRGTRAVQVLKGLVILLVIFFVAQRLNLDTINWLLGKVFPVAVLALIILFQPELRRVLASLGGSPFVQTLARHQTILDTIAEACHIMSKKRIGALIAIEDDVGLKNYIESGVKVDAQVSAELLMTIFHPRTPLHDGGAIVQEDRIAAAACLFPLTQHDVSDKSLGTRHRAAMGLAEESDAVVIVVSEETGTISVAMNGRLLRDLDREGLKKLLMKRLIGEGTKRGRFLHVRKKDLREIA